MYVRTLDVNGLLCIFETRTIVQSEWLFMPPQTQSTVNLH